MGFGSVCKGIGRGYNYDGLVECMRGCLKNAVFRRINFFYLGNGPDE